MRNLKLILLLTVIISTKLIVFSQTISSDSVKCFSYEQAKTIIKDLKKGRLCDSISQIQALQIVNFKEVIQNKNSEITIKNSQFSAKSKELKTANLKLKISKNLSKFGIPTALLGGFLVGILVKN